LEQLPQRIDALEKEIAALQDTMSDAGFFSQPHDETQRVIDALANAESELEAAFERWESLEAQKNG